jgi:hypothetical protein
MGVSIHYRGKMADISTIDVLCDEMTLVADKMNWTCTRLDDDWSKPADATIEVTEKGSQITGHLALKGIAFSIHPKCESFLINDKIAIISSELSRVAGSNIEKLSADDLASMIEGLLVAKLDEEDGEE